MGLRVDVDDLMAVKDIAVRFNVGMAAVSNWQVRYDDFPEPVVVVAQGSTALWRRPDIEAWAARAAQPRQRRPGPHSAAAKASARLS